MLCFCCSFPVSCMHANMWKLEKLQPKSYQKKCDIKRTQFSLVFLRMNFFHANPRMIQRKWILNWKLEKKIYFWHIERSLTGQLKSDFQSKPNFIKSSFHQSIDFSHSLAERQKEKQSRKWRMNDFQLFRFSRKLFSLLSIICRSWKFNQNRFERWSGSWCWQRWWSSNDGRHWLWRPRFKWHVTT